MLQFFSWDDAKSEANRRKHGVSFAAARLVFDDPLHISRQHQVVDGEVRWQTTGWADGMVLLLFAHTWHEAEDGVEHIRIVSARRATKWKRKTYEEGP